MEKAISWNKLIEKENLTKADIARQEQKSRAYITIVMKLLQLPQDIQKALLDKSYPKTSFKNILNQYKK
jgi:ParB/RepB/Spo0J family partition protein